MITDYDEKVTGCLLKIASFEENVPKKEWSSGWTWDQVAVAQVTINKLITMDLVKRTFSSNSMKAHMLTDKAKEYIEKLKIVDVSTGEQTDVHVEDKTSVEKLEQLTQSMFDDVIGYENLKELMRESILTDKPIHILLAGPPALAKSLLLYDIERSLPQSTMWIIGSATSRAGLWDGVAERRPRILLIDEIDKMTVTDTSALLSLMEKGRLVRTKVGRKMDIQLDVWVIGSANRTSKMSPELLSRFKIYQVSEYDAVSFREVVKKALSIHEGLHEDIADEIALRLINKTKDVRDAIRVARLSKRVGVARAVELLVD